MTIKVLKGGACSVEAGSLSVEVFPEKPQKDMWTLLAHPEEALRGEKIISWPGEYDFSGASVRAIGQEEGKQVSYACDIEGVSVAFVSAPVLEWSDKDVEKLGDIDVLVVAADAPKKVQDLMEEVDPRMVILYEVAKGDLAGVAKACGMEKIEKSKDLKIKKGSLPQDSREVVVLG